MSNETQAIETTAAAAGIATAFVQARRQGASVADFPGDIPPDLVAAYGVQDLAIAQWPDRVVGWKVGYITADRSLAPNIAKAHQLLTFTTPPNLQRAVAVGLGLEDSYFAGLSASLQAKRDRLAAGLAGLGFTVMPAQGSYFITVDVRPIGFTGDDVAFCRAITEEAKVTAIPVSAFYDGAEAPSHYARFAFCKADVVLDEAVARLGAWIQGRKAGVRAAG